MTKSEAIDIIDKYSELIGTELEHIHPPENPKLESISLIRNKDYHVSFNFNVRVNLNDKFSTGGHRLPSVNYEYFKKNFRI